MAEREEGYLQYLPPVLWEEAAEGDFLRRFLRIFEHGFNEIEEKVDGIPKLFNPWTTPAAFLPWLAAWVDLDLDNDWSEREKRAVISRAGTLHEQRGTLEGLKTYLELYQESFVEINELPELPHQFQVIINLPENLPQSELNYLGLKRLARQVFTIVDWQKPAHTYFEYEIRHPLQLQIGVHSQIGVDTILGVTPENG